MLLPSNMMNMTDQMSRMISAKSLVNVFSQRTFFTPRNCFRNAATLLTLVTLRNFVGHLITIARTNGACLMRMCHASALSAL